MAVRNNKNSISIPRSTCTKFSSLNLKRKTLQQQQQIQGFQIEIRVTVKTQKRQSKHQT